MKMREPYTGERVFVYFNLHRKCWSVKSLVEKRVILHTDEVKLFECSFRVSKAGRERVLRERRKNVHAGVAGKWTPHDVTKMWGRKAAVRYNPYLYETFVEVDTEVPVKTAEAVAMGYRTVCAINPK